MKFLAVPLFLVIVLFVSNIIAWAGFLWSYKQFTDEDPILVLHFEKEDHQHYIAHVESPSSSRGEYEIYGDQWRVDARFVKMKYWANLLGVDSRYALDRLQGRYIQVRDQNTLPNLAHQLEGDSISHFSVFGWTPFVDIEYGSSTYQKMDEGKKFTVYKTPTGLLVRSEFVVAEEQKEGWFNRLPLWR